MRRLGSGLITILILLLLVGALVYFYSSHKRQVASDLATVQQKSAVLQQKSQDMGTTSTVKMAFELNQTLSHYPIEVRPSAGVVTLAGKVSSDADKVLAERVAKETSGVKDVVNNIAVVPTPDALVRAERDRAADLEIKSAVLESFLQSPDLKSDSSGIHVEVSNKVVNLTGRVSSPQTKSKAVNLARSVSGVQAVNDSGLQVTGSSSGYTTEVF